MGGIPMTWALALMVALGVIALAVLEFRTPGAERYGVIVLVVLGTLLAIG